jgi:hypothetical protein
MAASSYATLYQFESHLEAGFKTVLEGVSGLDVRQTRDTDEQATPRCSLRVAVGGVFGDKLAVAPGGSYRYSHYTANLSLDIVTNRRTNQSSHATVLGQVRDKLYDWRNFSETAFPLVVVLRCLESGNGGPGIRDGEDDVTSLNFELVFAVRDSAWPV